MPDPELKMWLAVRTDIAMPRGKLATQAGHGYAGCLLAAHLHDQVLVERYMADAMPKITVQVSSEAALRRVLFEAEEVGIPSYFVMDAARTVFPEPTPTVCAFGPALRDDLPAYLKRLRLLED